jgi:voltage-gated potassium channel Kch
MRYRSDEVLARGTVGVLLWLGAIFLAVVLATALVVTILDQAFSEDQEGFIEAAWGSLMRTLDAGTMSGDNGWGLRIAALFVTVAGIFLASALIGIIATGLDQKIAELQKGRSFVVEEEHTAILGWSPRLFTIVSELTIANENHPGLAVVVLADRDKMEMEDAIRDRVTDLRGSKLVCRTGDPANPHDLGIVNVESARSVVVLGEEGPSGDAEVVKTVLALGSRDGAVGRIPVVAEITEERTARALGQAFGRDVLTVRSTDVVARVTAQSCRQSGLSAVVQELMDFDGDEIYFQEIAELEGRTFRDALLGFETSTLIGLQRADGTIEVCPPMDAEFGRGDRVIAVSEDDDTVVFTGISDAQALPGIGLREAETRREHMLIVGWNHLGPRVLHELDPYVAAGSRADLVVDPGLTGDELDVDGLTNFTVEITKTSDEADVVQQLAAVRPYTSIIILGYREGPTPSEADARSLLALLLLDRGLDESGRADKPRIVVELLDAKDVDLAKVSGADDFVVSDALASLMMAQLSEHPELAEVFRQIYTAADSTLYMEPADGYVAAGEISFAQVVATTAAGGACAIGWRRVVDGEAEVVVNPKKSDRVQFAPGDHIVVIG